MFNFTYLPKTMAILLHSTTKTWHQMEDSRLDIEQYFLDMFVILLYQRKTQDRKR